MEFYGLPPIGQKQRRPMDGAQFHTPWVGESRWTTIKKFRFFGQPDPPPVRLKSRRSFNVDG
jgi:hypothetical protein